MSTENPITREHLPGLLLARTIWENGGPSLYFPPALQDATDQARAALPAPIALPDGYVLVPQRMELLPEDIAVIMFHCGGDEDATEIDEQYQGGLLWVGETQDDDGNKVYGLNIACIECLEEGSTPLVEFAATPQTPAKVEPQPVRDDDLVLVPRGLIGAACYAIEKQVPSPNVLEKMRGYRFIAGQPALRLDEEVRESLDEAASILRNMIDSIGVHGNYSQESTLNFLSQALGSITFAQDTQQGEGVQA